MKVVHLRSALADEEREISFWNERAAPGQPNIQ